MAGRHNDPLTVPLPGNEHRIVSEMQGLWPHGTVRNPDGSPLLRAAAWVRGLTTLIEVLSERGLKWIPPFLERLDEWLVAEEGRRWWEKFAAQEDNDEHR